MKRKIFNQHGKYLVTGHNGKDFAKIYTARGLENYLINNASDFSVCFGSLNNQEKDRFGRAYHKGIKLNIKKIRGL